MNFDTLKSFLQGHGIEPQEGPVSDMKFRFMILDAKLVHGKQFSQVVMDCFSTPNEGRTYDFDPTSWDELRQEFAPTRTFFDDTDKNAPTFTADDIYKFQKKEIA